MKFKKSMIMLVLVIFLFAVASVSASETDNPISSDDTAELELSADDEIIEENPALTLNDNEETLSEETETDVSGANSATYSTLAEEINESGNITLKLGWET